jgi:hypothetical protein
MPPYTYQPPPAFLPRRLLAQVSERSLQVVGDVLVTALPKIEAVLDDGSSR